MSEEPTASCEHVFDMWSGFGVCPHCDAEKDAKIAELEEELSACQHGNEDMHQTLHSQAQEIERFKREVERLVACHGPQLLARDKLLEQAKENCGEWSDIASGQSEQIALWRPVIQAATIQAEAADSGNRDYWLTATIKTEQAARILRGKGGEDFEERGKG